MKRSTAKVPQEGFWSITLVYALTILLSIACFFTGKKKEDTLST